MKRSGGPAVWLPGGAVLCILLLLLSLVILLSPVLAGNADDVDFLAAAAKPGVREALIGLDQSLGRFYAELKFTLLGWAYLGASPWWIGTWRFGLAVLQLGLGGLLVSRLLGDMRWGLLFALILAGAACYVPTYHLLVSYPQVGFGFVLVLASWLLWLRGVGSDSPVARGAAAALFALSLLMHEVFLCFLSVHALLALREAGWRGLRHLWAPLLVASAYCALFLVTAHQGRLGGASYGGIQLSLRPGSVLSCLAVQGLSSLPGVEVLIDRSAFRFLAPPNAQCLSFSTTTDWCLGAAAGLSSFLLLRGLCARAWRGRRVRGAGVCFALAFIPSLLISLTPKYQEWSHHRIFPYIYASLGTGFFVLALLWLVAWASWRLEDRKWLRQLAPCLLGLGLCLLVVVSRSITRRSLGELAREGPGVAHSWTRPHQH